MTEYGDIYLMRSKGDNIPYVGISVNVNDRIKHHLNSIDKLNHHSYKINDYCKKYNKTSEDFYFTILEKSISKKYLNYREYYWIMYFDSFNNGFNCTTGNDQNFKVTKTKSFVYCGKKFNSISEAANYYKITYGTMKRRLYSGKEINIFGNIHQKDRNISQSKIKYKDVIWDNKIYKNVFVASKNVGIPYHNLIYYVKCGYTKTTDITKETKNKRRANSLKKEVIWNNKKFDSVKSAANYCKISDCTMTYRLEKGYNCDNDMANFEVKRKTNAYLGIKTKQGKKIKIDEICFYTLVDAAKFYEYKSTSVIYKWLKTGKAQYID